MSVYSVKGKGWRYDFTHQGVRYTETWFKTKKEAAKAETIKREEIKNPKPIIMTPTDITFLELVNKRLDHVKAYHSDRHYREYVYMARRWIRKWKNIKCNELSQQMIERFLIERRKVSAYTANKEIRYLRATFNLGLKKKFIIMPNGSPLDGIDFFPVEKRLKYVPSPEEVDMVIAEADKDAQDYLITIRETMGRMREINRLTWDEVNFKGKFIVLYTRKKKGGHLTPRTIPMTQLLYDRLKERFDHRDKSKPWVFWHSYKSRKTGELVEGPFKERKKIMKSLCRKAGVRYFRYHAIRHSGASIMDCNNVPIGSIQRILGHENRTTTEIYLHNIGQSDREAMAIFERSRQKTSCFDPHDDRK